MEIRKVDVNDAIQSGLMNKWLDVMLNGLMGKVSPCWNSGNHGNTLLRDSTSNNDEALLYYVLCHVGAGVNWTNLFELAKDKLEVGGAALYENLNAAKGEVRNVLSKQNMKRGSTYLFAPKTMKADFLPICRHLKSVRSSDVGKDWDRHLQTIYLIRKGENNAASDKSKSAKAAAAKKTEEDLQDELDEMADMMTD
jgi:hypothetical protein